MNNPFEILLKDVIKFLKILLYGFIILFENILVGKISVFDEVEKTVRIFETEVYENDIIEIKNCINEIERLQGGSKDIVFLNYNEYLTCKESNYFRDDKQRKAFNIIISLNKLFYDISMKLYKSLYYHYKANELSDEELYNTYNTKNNPIKNEENNYRFIPYFFCPVVGEGIFKERKIIDVLEYITTFAVNFCTIFNQENIIKEINKKENLIEKMENILKNLNKLE